MKEKLLRSLPAVLALLFGLLCVLGLCVYSSPMENVSLDLSLGSLEDGAEANFDSKGWTVYTREGETVTELTPDGFGGYTGLALGQTFYFSRVMEEKLDSPTLQFPPMESCYSIWLDDTLIYTDCPDLDNRIGYVHLPMNEYYRSDPITISLPMDYQGKTLTIAQSFPEWSETGSVRAWPASVKLHCGYAYESELISETFRTTVLACIGFLITMVLLAAFVRSRDWSILCMALVASLWMAQQLVGTSFFIKYFGSPNNSPTYLFPSFSALALLTFLTLRGSKYKKFLWPLIALSGLAVAGYLLAVLLLPRFNFGSTFLWSLDTVLYWLLFVTLVSVMVLSVLHWRKENWFFRVFTLISLVAIGLVWIGKVAMDPAGVWQQLTLSLSQGRIHYVYSNVLAPVSAATLVTVIAESVKNELDRRAEQQMIEQRRELALESYDNLRRQHEEVMMIRHDMLRHFRTLHDMDGEQRRTEYLAELIGLNEKVRPVVDSGNEMLDIILNGRLGAAIDAGIQVELPHISAPEKLPLSDPDLCALFLNLLDNAVAAASATEKAFLLLKFHQKDGHFAIVCENSFDPHKTEIEAKKETASKHGLGLKIVSSIVEKYQGAILTESSDDRFSAKIVIPLDAE